MNTNNFISFSVIVLQNNTNDDIGRLVDMLREKNNHGKDKSKFLKVLDEYKKYKRDYARNIKFEPNGQSLSKDDIQFILGYHFSFT